MDLVRKMSNPFERIGQSHTKQEVSIETTPRLMCSICKKEVVRSEIGRNDWVHEDERISLKSLKSNYDHQANPNFIDVEGTEQ